MRGRCRAVVVAAALVLLSSSSAVGQAPLSADVLLYGFAPFDTFDVNPTRALVKHLTQRHPERHEAVLSVSPEDALGELYALMAARPRVIIGFGVRADVQDLEVNTAATNWLAMRSESSTPY
ncbi:MAG: hypothetical protein QF464_02455, partial [Myxococcota bacterium]|nr:hypothetical protein [Myxococcota bacterium]